VFYERTQGPFIFYLRIFLWLPAAFSEIVILQNGDRFTAREIRRTDTTLFVEHDILGTLRVPRDQVVSIADRVEEKKKRRNDKRGI